jgi:hypothetical protein
VAFVGAAAVCADNAGKGSSAVNKMSSRELKEEWGAVRRIIS